MAAEEYQVSRALVEVPAPKNSAFLNRFAEAVGNGSDGPLNRHTTVREMGLW